jgi:hypothetical protein
MRILSVRHLLPRDLPKGALYVGRTIPGWRGHALANPFSSNEGARCP